MEEKEIIEKNKNKIKRKRSKTQNPKTLVGGREKELANGYQRSSKIHETLH